MLRELRFYYPDSVIDCPEFAADTDSPH